MSAPVIVLEPFLTTSLVTVAIEPESGAYPPRMGFGDHTEARRYAAELAVTYGLLIANYLEI